MISGVWFADENIINFGALSISHIQMYSMLSGFERVLESVVLSAFEVWVWAYLEVCLSILGGLGLSVLGGVADKLCCCVTVVGPAPTLLPFACYLQVAHFTNLRNHTRCQNQPLYFVNWWQTTFPTSNPPTDLCSCSHLRNRSSSVLRWTQCRLCITMSPIHTLCYYDYEPSTDSVCENWASLLIKNLYRHIS